MSDNKTEAKTASSTVSTDNHKVLINKVNEVLMALSPDAPKLTAFPASDAYIDSLDNKLEKLLFAAWKLGRCDARDARFYSVLPRALEIGDASVVEVLLEAKPRHRNR